MSSDTAHLKERARECRLLAEQAKDPYWRETLLELADDLEREAEAIDPETRA